MIELDGANILAYNPIVGGVKFNESEIRLSDSYGLGIEKIC
jgi:hypothetical protein